MKKLTSEQLEAITQCKSLSEVRNKFLEFKQQEEYETLISSCRSHHAIKYINRKSHALIFAIPALAVPIDTFFYATAYKVELSLLGDFAFILLGAGGALSIYLFCNTYKNRKLLKNELVEDFQLAELKLQALNELTRREKNLAAMLLNQTKAEMKPPIALNNVTLFSPTQPSCGESFAIGGAITTVLSYTLLNVASFFQSTDDSFLLSAALATTLGSTIAAGTALVVLGIGIYLGHKHYQSKKAQCNIEAEQKRIESDMTEQREAYREARRQRERMEDRIADRKWLLQQQTSVSTPASAPPLSRSQSASLSPAKRPLHLFGGTTYQQAGDYRLLTINS